MIDLKISKFSLKVVYSTIVAGAIGYGFGKSVNFIRSKIRYRSVKKHFSRHHYSTVINDRGVIKREKITNPERLVIDKQGNIVKDAIGNPIKLDRKELKRKLIMQNFVGSAGLSQSDSSSSLVSILKSGSDFGKNALSFILGSTSSKIISGIKKGINNYKNLGRNNDSITSEEILRESEKLSGEDSITNEKLYKEINSLKELLGD